MIEKCISDVRFGAIGAIDLPKRRSKIAVLCAGRLAAGHSLFSLRPAGWRCKIRVVCLSMIYALPCRGLQSVVLLAKEQKLCEHPDMPERRGRFLMLFMIFALPIPI